MRKLVASLAPKEDQIAEALDDWRMLTQVRYELAQEAFQYQDEHTQEVIGRIVNRLRLGANGHIKLMLSDKSFHVVKVEQEFLDFNLLYVACEILRDLALFDVKLANYEFPSSLCSKCSAEITLEQPKKRRR